ncbi:MAG: hypothetical protein QF689_17765 [Candidatus Latescibacteria bacterium]|jgi:hypothetical protein|nr:hypothetical protein [Gemmatimonadaceae bacterium]MDP6014648.1 hypothetical protein [Candidatus Latescibacterota bacterium]MDP7450442.1 hypothetical protein [Candidatus Latescibacterota bacterium]HJP29251.1 hypothetical protein [Candidatus Latescibacterota bacterium]|tara:strand:+ start:638 stop:976 length:339 start_codon:yes stop_codon:yes gene_type:complete
MTIEFYKWLHLSGLGLTLLAIGGLAWRQDQKLLSITHGIGLLIALIGGFGLVARYAIDWPWPGWLWIKIVVWLIFGASPVLLKRLPQLNTPLWWGLWVLFLVAAYLGVFKPF